MRRFPFGISAFAALAWLAGCQSDQGNVSAADTGNSDDAALVTHARDRGPNISVTFRPVDHTVSLEGAFFLAELIIHNDSTVRLEGPHGARAWKLYFSFFRRVLNEGEGNETLKQNLAEQGVRIGRGDAAGSGDYRVLEPLANFVPIEPGATRTIRFLAVHHTVAKTDAPAGFHIVFPPSTRAWAIDANVELDASNPKQTTRSADDVMPTQTPRLRFDENALLEASPLSPADSIVPRPQRVAVREGRYHFGGSRVIIDVQRGLAKEAAYLEAVLEDVLRGPIETETREDAPRDAAVRLSIDPAADLGAEGYALTIDAEKGIDVRGADAAGVFYGIQTLRQLIPIDVYRAARDPAARRTSMDLPALAITDGPLFPHRGMTLDVARHFHSKATVERLLDLLALHKINKFHLHLTDDEGWRLEVPGIPELTSYSGRRGFDLDERRQLHIGLGASNDLGWGDGILGKANTAAEANGGTPPTYQGFELATLNFVGQGSGYYTARDFEEILAYATERHIEVIPEIDVPGHARAMTRAMEHRYQKYAATDPVKATQYRLVDPDDTSKHTSVQGYTDNVVNPCLNTTYAFFAKVVAEIKARYDAVPGAKLSLIHAGGDELPSLQRNVWWQGSPLCKSDPATKDLDDRALVNRFFTKVHAILDAAGVGMTGWDDIIHHGLELDGFVPMPWNNVWGWGTEDDAYKYANQGRKVILASATNLYMDLAYNKDPEEPGTYWAAFVDEKKTFEYLPFDYFAIANEDYMGHRIPPSTWDAKTRLTAEGRANVLGMHGLLWGENLKSAELVDYFAFPKLLGVAERAWNRHTPAPEELPAAWKQFVNTLGQAALPRLDDYRPVDLRRELARGLPPGRGVNYRVPPPGAKVENGMLYANVRYPGMAIEYSTNDGASFVRYPGPVAVSGHAVLLRTKTTNGHVSRLTKVP